VPGITGNGQPIEERYRQEELGHLLSAAGYECIYGGKWHVPEIAIPEGHGFRSVCGFDDVALPYAVSETLRAPHARPFFLVASFDNPHNICEWRRQQNVPWGPIGASPGGEDSPNAPPRMEDCPSLPANYPIPPFEPEAIRIIAGANPRIYPDARYTAEQWRRYRWGYSRLVEKVDAQIGQILSVLDETGLAENTVVIFSSDHGDAAGSHHLAQKNFTRNRPTCPLSCVCRAALLCGWTTRTWSQTGRICMPRSAIWQASRCQRGSRARACCR
jgi:arylsulfatase A-like enzyme